MRRGQIWTPSSQRLLRPGAALVRPLRISARGRFHRSGARTAPMWGILILGSTPGLGWVEKSAVGGELLVGVRLPWGFATNVP